MNINRCDLYEGERIKCEDCGVFIEYPGFIDVLYDWEDSELCGFMCGECTDKHVDANGDWIYDK